MLPSSVLALSGIEVPIQKLTFRYITIDAENHHKFHQNVPSTIFVCLESSLLRGFLAQPVPFLGSEASNEPIATDFISQRAYGKHFWIHHIQNRLSNCRFNSVICMFFIPFRQISLHQLPYYMEENSKSKENKSFKRTYSALLQN